MTVAGARQRPHRPGVTAPDHGPTREGESRAEYPPTVMLGTSAQQPIRAGTGAQPITVRDGDYYRDPLPPLRQTAGQRPGRRCPYRVQVPPLWGVHHSAGHAPRSCRPWSLSCGGTVAAKRRPYHPPVLSDWLPPLAGPPGYIMGETGPQGFGTADYFVAQIPCATAREIIRRKHYSHSVVNNSYVNLGVFLEGAIVGVLQWGYALNPARAGKVVANTTQGQYLELNRMWLSDDAPRNSESRAISYSLKYIRRACPSVAWVQSFADERCQGLGVVYQACSFLYLGSHTSPFYELDGGLP